MEFKRIPPQFKFVANELGKLGKKIKLLDVGAGEQVLRDIIPKNVVYHSMDYGVKSNIKLSLNKEFDYRFNLDKGRFPIKNGTYDAVVCLDTLEHVLYPEKVINEIKRITKEDAVFFLAMPNEYSFVFRIYHFVGHITWCDEPFKIVSKHLHIHRPRVKDIISLFSENFKILEIKYIWQEARFPKVLNKIIEVMAQIFPNLFARQVLVIAVKKD